jgi:hypothetical protein
LDFHNIIGSFLREEGYVTGPAESTIPLLMNGILVYHNSKCKHIACIWIVESGCGITVVRKREDGGYNGDIIDMRAPDSFDELLEVLRQKC